MKHLGLILSLSILAACGGREAVAVSAPPTTAAPKRASSNVLHWRMDSGVEAIFGADSSLYRIPEQFRFSPDSAHLAYLQTQGPRTELWMHTIETGIRRPLFSGENAQVTAFVWAASNHVLLISNGDVWMVSLTGQSQQITATNAHEHGIQASQDGTKAAYIRDHNIYIYDLTTMSEIPVTTKGSPKRTFGEVTWLYQEEFDTTEGFGFAPKGNKLWFFETNLEKVPFRIIDRSPGDTEFIPYPRAGEENPEIRIGVIDLDSNARVFVRDGAKRDVYLPRVVWHPSGESILVTELDRLQTHLSVYNCPLRTQRCSAVLDDQDPRYVNLLGNPVFFNHGKEFFWLSETTGYAQIERVNLSTRTRRAVTEGKFEVIAINHVDEKNGRVLFTANPEDITETRLYASPIGGGEIKTLPQASGTHSVIFSPNGEVYVDTHSALDRPPTTVLKNREGKVVAILFETDPRHLMLDDVHNEIFPMEQDNGIPLMAHLTRPKNLESDKKYPVLIIMYGGPHVQFVANRFHQMYQPWRNLLAKRGIIVFSVDGRGSAGRGHLFESRSRLRLGHIELADQLAGRTYLSSLPFVDPDRIGVFGWSYGGYMVLNALLRSPEPFRFGISVAPVTNWRNYDTAYTERYMLRPKDNVEGYRKTALMPLAGQLKSPLLLIHGMADDNVHLIHSFELLNSFIEAGRNVDQLFYPGKNHKIDGAKTRVHLFTHIIRFIEEHQ